VLGEIWSTWVGTTIWVWLFYSASHSGLFIHYFWIFHSYTDTGVW